VLLRPLLKRIPADAPGCHATGSGVADDAADRFRPVVHCPFRTFCGLARGFVAQTGKRTVCGVLAGAGLSGVLEPWPGAFLLPARWNPDDLGLAARLAVALLVPAGEDLAA
jgi:hypothetical protein